MERWSNFHVTYATPPRCKTLFPNCTIIYIVKQRVIYVVFVSVYLLHLLHLSSLIGTKSAQRRLAPPLRSPLSDTVGCYSCLRFTSAKIVMPFSPPALNFRPVLSKPAAFNAPRMRCCRSGVMVATDVYRCRVGVCRPHPSERGSLSQ